MKLGVSRDLNSDREGLDRDGGWQQGYSDTRSIYYREASIYMDRKVGQTVRNTKGDIIQRCENSCDEAGPCGLLERQKGLRMGQ